MKDSIVQIFIVFVHVNSLFQGIPEFKWRELYL